jgi:peptide subunit release factor RF-3
MTDEEFQRWLEDEVAHDRMSKAQMEDLLQQKKLFDADRKALEQKYAGQIVGFVDSNLQVGGTVHEVLDKAKARAPGRMVYFEAIGTELF